MKDGLKQMEFNMLLTSTIPPVPLEITVVKNWGSVTIRDREGRLVTGEHIRVLGDKASIADWLGDLEGFWKGVGSPIMQEFEVVHVDKEEE